MKPLMLFAIVVLVAIVIVVSFGLQLEPSAPIEFASDAAANVLYVCPGTSAFFDNFANNLQPVHHILIIVLFAVIMLLAFSWGWALYQNLLNDSFKRDTFKKPWRLTKWTFCCAVIALLFVMTPNYFRSVQVDGLNGEYVLCEYNSPNARAVPAESVHN